MPRGWTQTTLAEVATVVGGGTPTTSVPEYWGGEILWITPTEITAQEGQRIFATNRTITRAGLARSGARLLPAGTVLLTSRATIGAVAIAGREMATNQGFASLIPGQSVSSGFLMYWCQEHKADLIARAGGNTFLEVSKSNVASMTITLPPLEEQRRIVDLIDSVDAAALQTRAVIDRATAALERHLDGLGGERFQQLGPLVTMRSGPSWQSNQETTTPVEGAIPVIGITNTKADGRVDLTERRYVAGLPGTTRRLVGHSLIMIRTNGNRSRIGNVYRTTAEAVGSAVSAFQIAIDPVESVDATFLFWSLRSPRVQTLITNAASGTTGLGNIAIGWLRSLDLPWPSDDARHFYVDVAEHLDHVVQFAEAESTAYRELRAALLGDLLSGKHEIPVIYDALLEAV